MSRDSTILRPSQHVIGKKRSQTLMGWDSTTPHEQEVGGPAIPKVTMRTCIQR